MQVTEKAAEGLKRELEIVIPASELETSLTARLEQMKSQARINGFRPGKVPVAHLRKTYGQQAMTEVIQEAVTQGAQKAIEERKENPAYQPDIGFGDDENALSDVVDGKADLTFLVSFEIVPTFEIFDFSKAKLERPVAEVGAKEIDEALNRMVVQQKDFEPREGDSPAQSGDRVQIDFVGKVDGEAFDGGAAEDAYLEIGSNSYIPGFEEQLIGAKPGDGVKVKVTFPGEYGVEALSGKDAVFDVEVKEVAKPKDIPVDDEFAKRLGLEDLDKLKEAVGEQIKNEYTNFSDARVKRELLDILDEEHTFEVPEKLVEQEFSSIWQQVLGDLEKAKRTFEDEDTTEDEAKAEYRVIAERRVRLGLVLSQVGKAGDIQISDDEVNQALMERAREFPGQEKEVFEYYTKQAGAINEIRAPIYEQKVVNYIIELAEVTEKKVSAEELMRDPDEDEAKDDKKKPTAKKKPAVKKAAPKKVPAKKEAAKKKDD